MRRLVLALLTIPALAHAAPEGEIAYLAGSESSALRVHLLAIDSGTPRPMGPDGALSPPRWSPDGARLAFAIRSPAGAAIHILAPEAATGQTAEHQHPWNDAPQWANDNQRLAYSAGEHAALEQRVLVVYNTADAREQVWGGGRPGLLRPVWLNSTDLMLALQPDRPLEFEGIDFEGFRDEAFGAGIVLCIALHGEGGTLRSEPVLVTTSWVLPLMALLEHDGGPYMEWAIVPDSKARQIAWETNEGGDREIYVLGLRGFSNVTNHRAHDWNPVWSHSGNWLAFESLRGGRRGIYAAFPRTARTYAIAAPAGAQAWSPAFSPDEDHVVYVGDANGNPDLFLVEREDGEPKQLTENPGPDLAPAWRPARKDAGE